MSVGHVARILEENGIPTVIIAVEAFGEQLISMSPPRLLLTPFPMGRPIGRPGNSKQHKTVIKESLKLLESASGCNSVKRLDITY
ncbi:MAG: hypothetical protein ACQEP4_09305 [Bacillota bacterium]